jgi:2-oxo-4-hydroxy-4-carboxy--5-ureidoimidazoline (OHCU) decarboxylase
MERDEIVKRFASLEERPRLAARAYRDADKNIVLLLHSKLSAIVKENYACRRTELIQPNI